MLQKANAGTVAERGTDFNSDKLIENIKSWRRKNTNATMTKNYYNI